MLDLSREKLAQAMSVEMCATGLMFAKNGTSPLEQYVISVTDLSSVRRKYRLKIMPPSPTINLSTHSRQRKSMASRELATE